MAEQSLYEDALAWAAAREIVLPDEYYNRLSAQARNKAFAIAGIARLDLLQSVQDSLNTALESGLTMSDWKKTLPDSIASLPRHRLDNIFRTNIQQSYMAGIARNQERPEALARRPFFQYDAINDSRTRPSHAALDNVIAPAADPFWHTHTPPLGYRCRCTRIALSEKQAIARGYDPAKPLPDVQPDKGFAGHPLAADGWAGINSAIDSRMAQCGGFSFAARRSSKKPMLCDGTAYDYISKLSAATGSDKPMPEPRRMDIQLLSPGLPKQAYVERFMREFDAPANETVIIKDKTGLHELAVSELLFTDHLTGASKADKRGRLPYLLYLARTILDPDEIRFQRGGHQDAALYFISSYIVQGEIMRALAVFKHQGKVWTGWTAYPSWSIDYINGKRGESTMIYRREK